MGLIAEWMPWRWRRWFVPECRLIVSGLVSYAWSSVIDDGMGGFRSVLDPSYAFAGWIRMVLVFWALIPSRPYMVKVVAGLAAGELILIADMSGNSLWFIGLLTAITFLALFFEQWMSQTYASNDQVEISSDYQRKPWTIAVLTAVLLVVISTGLGEASRQVVQPVTTLNSPQESAGNANDSVKHLSTTIGLDESSFSDQDPTLTARLIWNDSAPAAWRGWSIYAPSPSPELYLDDNRIRWRSVDFLAAAFYTVHSRSHGVRWATLFRQLGSGSGTAA